MAHKRFKDYQEYLQSDKWRHVKEDWYENNTDHVTCRVEMTDADDEPMVLHHWRYPKDWNDDSHENLILISCRIHQWLHDGYHDEHLDWADEICMYLANVNMRWDEEVHIGELDDRRLQRASLESKIEKLQKDLKSVEDDLEDITLLKRYYKTMFKESKVKEEQSEYKSKY